MSHFLCWGSTNNFITTTFVVLGLGCLWDKPSDRVNVGQQSSAGILLAAEGVFQLSLLLGGWVDAGRNACSALLHLRKITELVKFGLFQKANNGNCTEMCSS